jgi:hypothetical protein
MAKPYRQVSDPWHKSSGSFIFVFILSIIPKEHPILSPSTSIYASSPLHTMYGCTCDLDLGLRRDRGRVVRRPSNLGQKRRQELPINQRDWRQGKACWTCTIGKPAPARRDRLGRLRLLLARQAPPLQGPLRGPWHRAQSW